MSSIAAPVSAPVLSATRSSAKCECGRAGEMHKPPSWAKLRRMDRLQARYFQLWLRLGTDIVDRPRIPQQLSEGLVAYLTPELFGPGVRCSGKTKRTDPDLLLHTADCCRPVEVKGSGSSGWVEVTDKDLEADYLVWAHFGDRYELDPDGEIRLFLLPEPAKVMSAGKPRVEDFALLPVVRAYSFDFATKTLTLL